MLPIFTGLLGTLIGLFLGNRLALWRDRRKEFNEITTPLFENLENQRIIALEGNFPSEANNLNITNFIALKRKLSINRQILLDEAVKNYEDSKHKCGYRENGWYQFSKPEILIDSIEKLQSFLPHK